MKCNDFLPAMANGGIIPRARAKWHAVRCAQCALVRERWRMAEREWAQPAAVTSEQRAMWEREAVDRPNPAMPRAARVSRWAFAAAACVLAIGAALAVSHWVRSPDALNVVKNQTTPSDVTEKPVARASDEAQFEEIKRGLDRLAIELVELGKQAELIDVRKEVNQLSTTYKPLGVSRDDQANAN